MTKQEAVEKTIKLIRLTQSSNYNEATLAYTRALDILEKYVKPKAPTIWAQEQSPRKEVDPELWAHHLTKSK